MPMDLLYVWVLVFKSSLIMFDCNEGLLLFGFIRRGAGNRYSETAMIQRAEKVRGILFWSEFFRTFFFFVLIW